MANPDKPAQKAHTSSARPVYHALGGNLAVAMAKLPGWGLAGTGTLLA